MARPESPLLDRSSRAWTLAATAACLLPLLLQLPRGLAIAIALVATLMMALCWLRPIPLPSVLRMLLALATLGTVLAVARFNLGRDTACAILAAMLAIKPSETLRIRDARSLLGFGLFAPFATFLLDQGPLSLLLGFAAVSLVLVALQRLADVDSGDLQPHAPLRRTLSAWRLILVGLPLALAAFWLFPRIHSPLWGIPDRAMGRPGLSDQMRPSEWLDLMSDDSVALRAEFFGATPAPPQMYWRGPVLWDFDGQTWTRPRDLRGHPVPAVEAGTQRWDYQVEQEPTDRRDVIALDVPGAAPDGAYLTHDRNLWSPRPLAALTRWRLQSSEPRQFQARLDPALRQRALALPQGFNPRALALAQQWRGEAGSNDNAVVDRALQMVRNEFAYTLATPPPGRDAVDEFLFGYKEGFCQHFSSAFVVLMRGAGIPSRVVTGYAGGFRNPIGGYWAVRRSDAHAWAEVWLDGRGWVRVDPTAAVAPERIYDTLADRAPAFANIAALQPMWNAGDWLRRGWNDFVLGFDADRQKRMLQALGMPQVDSMHLALLFACAAILALLWMLWLLSRRTRESDPMLRAWHRLSERYARFGLERLPSESAQAWARRVHAARPQSQALLALSARFALWRYAAADGDRTVQPRLLRDLQAHRP